MKRYSYTKIRTAQTIHDLLAALEQFVMAQMKEDGQIVAISDMTTRERKSATIVLIIKIFIDNDTFLFQNKYLTLNDDFTKFRMNKYLKKQNGVQQNNAAQ